MKLQHFMEKQVMKKSGQSTNEISADQKTMASNLDLPQAENFNSTDLPIRGVACFTPSTNHVNIYIYVCISISPLTLCTYIHAYVYIHTHIYVHTQAYIGLYVYIYKGAVCIYIYIHITLKTTTENFTAAKRKDLLKSLLFFQKSEIFLSFSWLTCSIFNTRNSTVLLCLPQQKWQ